MNYIINGNKLVVDDQQTLQSTSKLNFSNPGESDIQTPTEISEALKELNKDELDPNSRTSSIDMRTILHPYQINNISAFEALVKFGMLPQECLSLPVQIKRNAISQNGIGREQMVKMAVGRQEAEADKAGGGFKNWAGKFFGGNDNGGGQ